MAEVKEMRVSELVEYGNNPRRNERAVTPVANSLKKFGFLNPIIVNKENVILAGHTRLKAAKENGLETVPVLVVDSLTEDQENAFRLADNRVAELSSWDDEKLKEEFESISAEDWASFGVSDRELKNLEPKTEELTCPKCGHKFTE